MAAKQDGTSKHTAIKIIVLVLCLLAAGTIYFKPWQGSGDGQPNDPASATTYICPTDGTILKVTPYDFEQKYGSGDAGPAEGQAARTPGVFVRCPKCSKRIMVIGAICPKDQTVFAPMAADGQPAACPKCKWKPEN